MTLSERAIIEAGREIPKEVYNRWYGRSSDDSDRIYPTYDRKTIDIMKRAVYVLRMAYIYAKRVDWMLSGDDGEDDLVIRLQEELQALKAKYPSGKYTFKEKGLVGSTGSAYSSQSAIDAWENRDLDRYQEYRNFLNESGKSDSIDNWNKYKEGGAQAFTEKKTETKKTTQTTVPTVDTGDINWSSYGITNNYANEAYAKAKGEIPSLTPQVYANTFKSIDTSGNSKVTQDEVIAYLNNIGASDSQGHQIWAAYGSNNWKKIPVLGDNGTWKKK